ncbi:hypothetical protein J3U99_21690 [Brucella pituitosa]|uniref:hypothetical protein n=1 Tax=Brucella pituitosa TaxID=571256 RepID=UPI000C27A14E|nr:hypothetical protein [Brucella pituitosa]MCK4207375.1 hypothetical protein [Brucella pituitosa]PJO48510.1 hypothetical protein CWE02_01460 [Brucella pituitosa]PRA84463.1 hypothetical protein CQ054_15445 [Ochrobactrum sp. MYb29]
MNAKEIIGTSLYSDDSNEIEKVIQRNMGQHDEDVIAACAHAIGHLVRRFHVDVSTLRDSLIKESKNFGDSGFLSGAILDMDDDIKHFSRK